MNEKVINLPKLLQWDTRAVEEVPTYPPLRITELPTYLSFSANLLSLRACVCGGLSYSFRHNLDW